MRISRSTLVGTAVAVALFGGNAFAQQTTASQSDASKTDSNDTTTLQEVVVTGPRYSVKASIAAKRINTDMTEVATAEDVGKLPAKNVADVLQTLPGVDTSSSTAGEGAFADNDRVSLRGTPNSLTQTTIDGHFVSAGDWFIEDQYETVGRSVSYDLLPSQIVGQTVVNLSQNASMIEGGVAGSVDIQTRHPLDFKQGFSGYANAGAEYADLVGKAAPQGQLMAQWNNGSFGVLGMVFYDKEDLRRDAQEELGYGKVTQCIAVGCPATATTPAVVGWQEQNPSLPNATNALYPTLLGQTLFEQTQDKKGGLIDIQAKPSDALSVDLTGFFSYMDAGNTNDNYMFWGHIVEPNYVPTALTVQNGTIVSGTWPTEAGAPAAAVYDQITRPGTTADSMFVNLDAAYVASDNLTFDGQLGWTLGSGRTTYAPAYEWQGGNGASYTFNGYTNLTSVSFPGLATNNPGVNGVNNVGTSWAWDDVDDSVDKETYAKLDGTFKQDDGALEDLKFGLRFSHHSRDGQFAQDDGCTSYCWSNMPAYSGGEYPSNFQSGLGSSPWGGNIFTYSQGAIDAYDAAALTPDTNGARYYWLDSFSTVENELAGYVMEDVGGDNWSGNFGVRIVNTLEEVTANLSGGSNPLTFSAFGPFTPTEIDNRYFNVLPSANLKFDLTKHLVARFSAAETMALPDPSALGTGVELTDTNLTGNGGNANLKPVKGAVYSTDVEYYYGPESMIELALFDMDLSSYVDFGTSSGTYLNTNLSKTSPVYSVFAITSPFNTTAEIRGGTLSWIQALPLGFGVQTNFTLADGTSGDGNPVLGDSKFTYNVGAYWQQGPLSANLDYTYRSHYYAAVSASSPQNMANWYNLNAQANYDITNALSVTFSGRNLTNKIIYEYGVNTSQPVAIYDNGRQYFLNVNYKF
jgi:iron complex outermembrane receptor protein